MSGLNVEVSAKLKEEGNKFFASKQYSQAYDKYSKALKIGGDSAVIFSNRAACCMSMGRYLDACSDARKATELDPSYVKGWGRLAAAEQELGNWESALDAYKTALFKLPKTGLTAAEKKQKEQYESGLSIVEKKEKASKETSNVLRGRRELENERPLARASAILARGLPEECIFSSANTISMAGKELKLAMEGMRQLQKMHMPDGQMYFMGRLDVLENLTNSVLSDRRSFYIDDPKWMQRYNEQMTMQEKVHEAWPHDGPEVVLAEAQKRVSVRGWDATRPALSTTVRGWIMHAFLVSGFQRDFTSAEHFYRNAIEVLERGRKIWADVPKDDRGSIFEETFLFGVRAIHLEAFMQAHSLSGGSDPRFSADELDKLASDLLQDVEDLRNSVGFFVRRFDGEAFYLSYYVYPAAEARGIKAYSLKKKLKGKCMEERSQLLRESAACYFLAAQTLPEDDEYHCQYLMNSLGSWWLLEDTPLKTTLPLLAKLKEDVPKMKKIWKHSALSMQGRDDRIKECLNYYEDVQRKLLDGKLTENDVYQPSFTI